MFTRLLQGSIGLLPFVVPMAAGAQGLIELESVDPLCIHGLNANSQTITFTIRVRNTTPPPPDPNARTIWFVSGLDTVQSVSVVAVGPSLTSTATYTVNWGTNTLRLRPRAFGCWFASEGAANAFRDNMIAMINQIVAQLAGPIPPTQNWQPHQTYRAMIQNALDSLVPAIEAANLNQFGFRQQILDLEQQDQQPLQQIETIRGSYAIPGSVLDSAVIKMDLQIFQRIWAQQTGYSGRDETGAEGEEDPGADIWINDDDDLISTNGQPGVANGIPDKDEPPPTPNQQSMENDLVPLWWYFAKPLLQPQWMWPSPTWNLTINGPSTRLKYWRPRIVPLPPAPATSMDMKGSEASPWPIVEMANFSYDLVYVEGLASSPQDLFEQLVAQFAGNMEYEDLVRATVIGIVSVAWDFAPANAISWLGGGAGTLSYGLFDLANNKRANPIDGGERGWFPCRRTPGGAVQSTITVRVTMAPQREGQSIWVKSYDVDDPTWHTGPIDADDDAGPGANSDNRPTSSPRRAGLLKQVAGGDADAQNRLQGTTNASGIVEFRFDVSMCMQPGNNFRVAAGFTTNTIFDGPTAKRSDSTAKVWHTGGMLVLSDNDDSGDSQLRQTPLLTLWRELHIEVDRMAAATSTTQYYASRGGTDSTLSAWGPGNSRLSLNSNIGNGNIQGQLGWLDTGPSSSDGRFADPLPAETPPFGTGVARITANGVTMRLVSNAGDYVTVDGNAAPLANAPSFTLYDDDTYLGISPDLTTWAGRLSTPYKFLVHYSLEPSDNRLAYAYVVPVYDGGGGNFTGIVPFMLNSGAGTGTNSGTLANEVSPNRGSSGNNNPEFWTAYLLIAFQAEKDYYIGGDWRGDNDPNSPENASYALTYVGVPDVLRGSIVYMENQADSLLEYSHGEVDANTTVPHEIGWQFRCLTDSQLMGPASDVLSDSFFEEFNLGIIRSTGAPGAP